VSATNVARNVVVYIPSDKFTHEIVADFVSLLGVTENLDSYVSDNVHVIA
jgi:hypothetical protein